MWNNGGDHVTVEDIVSFITDVDRKRIRKKEKEELMNKSKDLNGLTSQLNELRGILSEREAKLSFLQLQLDRKSSDGNPIGDVVIVVQDNTDELLYAHKFILSDKSSVFRKMFDTEMVEKQSGVVRINDATLPVMRAVINYCYTAEIDFSDEVTPDEVLAVAHKYAIDLLRKLCEEELIKTIDGFNMPKRLKLSKKSGAKGLQEAATRYFKENFDDVLSGVLEELCICDRPS